MSSGDFDLVLFSPPPFVSHSCVICWLGGAHGWGDDPSVIGGVGWEVVRLDRCVGLKEAGMCIGSSCSPDFFGFLAPPLVFLASLFGC